MPRKSRNPGSGKKPVNTPARGAGWGGEAKGASSSAGRMTGPAFMGDENPTGLPGYRGLAKAAVVEMMMGVLWDVAIDPDEPSQNRVVAADKVLDRVEGKPVQKVVTADVGAGWFIEGVAELTEEEWTRQAQLMIARPAGSAD